MAWPLRRSATPIPSARVEPCGHKTLAQSILGACWTPHPAASLQKSRRYFVWGVR
jgi:hypothetical protein